ncbi:TetR family transcriptional regulator [Streptomyces sp. SL13]|uniref:TetR family transcriptional regulator n=1 Tax=Streptantibioticus silvisoli TaxID=2705255 RepID=A0AA90H3H7_9ACTN|nr:TetR family transcriptional regulator [Streptantibioticus silvisoli]MDI5970060.1 TetR family transcriptional regulator [Streptantibioticus silvisoli]
MASATPSDPPAPSLRERKKIKTRRAIRTAAYRLFESQGYEATPVEQIAADAEVSPSTFFRYFPTKEDVVLSDEYDPVMRAAIASRPAGEPLVVSMRAAIADAARQMFQEDRGEILLRMRLCRQVPAIRTRLGENVVTAQRLLTGALSQRDGRPADDLELRVLAGALMGGWTEALLYWSETGAAEPLPDLLDRTLTMISEGMTGSR